MLDVVRFDDPEVAVILAQEKQRQQRTLNMIASENSAPVAIMEAESSLFTNKAAEGYPGRRFHAGCQYTDAIESLAIQRAKNLFQAEHVNVQPHSGVNANMAVYFAVLKVGDPILSMKLDHGGHISHGAAMSLTGHCYQFRHYGVHRETELIDYEEVRSLAKAHQPKMIVGGASSYPRLIDFAALREIADEVGAYLLIDMAHIAGLVAAGIIPSPVPYADFVTFTTYKTLMGGRGGMILCKKLSKNRSRDFPGTQGPAVQSIAAKAVVFNAPCHRSFGKFKCKLSRMHNAAQALHTAGYRLVTGGTDNHLVLIDLRGTGLKGNTAEALLEKIGILTNKNVSYDPESPMVSQRLTLRNPGIDHARTERAGNGPDCRYCPSGLQPTG